MGARRFLVEDGISACMAALRGGIVPGGCCTFKAMIHAVEKVEPKGINAERAQEIFLKTLKRPLELLISNAVEGGAPGHETFSLMNQFLSKERFGTGLNVRSMEFGDLDEMKVWEPALVPLTALKIAFGCATTLGNTKAMIVNREEGK